MDDNVMKTYSKLPQEAAQYVQYEQGKISAGNALRELDRVFQNISVFAETFWNS